MELLKNQYCHAIQLNESERYGIRHGKAEASGSKCDCEWVLNILCRSKFSNLPTLEKEKLDNKSKLLV